MKISLNPNRSTGRPTSDPQRIAPNRKEPQTTLWVLFGSTRLWEDSFTDLHGSLFPHLLFSQLRSTLTHETPQPPIRAMVEQPEQPRNDGTVYRTIPQLRNDPR